MLIQPRRITVDCRWSIKNQNDFVVDFIDDTSTLQSLSWANRLTQSVMYVPLQVNKFHESILLIVQYKYLKSCSENF